MTRLGQKIAVTRRRRGLSLRDVAALAGLSYQSVLNAERGNVKPENAVRIGTALGLGRNTLAKLAASDLVARTG